MKHYDVVIIGAGPGGLACANVLKGSSQSVLLIEKKRIIGDKPCAGGLIPTVNQAHYPPDQVRIPKHIISIDKKKTKTRPTNTKVISRTLLGRYMFDRIKNAANIDYANETVVLLENNTVVLKSGEQIQYTQLVGADGSSSIVRRSLGLKSKYMQALYYEIPVITNDLIAHHYPEVIHRGYVWSFPHVQHTNIGVYYDPAFVPRRNALAALHDFLQKQGIQLNSEKLKGGRENYCYRGLKFKNIYLVGDAAGLIYRINGEGISGAILSGEEVARQILNPRYPMAVIKKQLRLKMFLDTLYRLLTLRSYFGNLFKRWLFTPSLKLPLKPSGQPEDVRNKYNPSRKQNQAREPDNKYPARFFD